MPWILRPTFIASVLGLVACNTSVDSGPDAGSPSCVAANDHSDVDFLETKVYAPSCASFSSCHMGSAQSAGGLNLEVGMSQAALVNQPAKLAKGMVLVKPGDPMHSYLMIILGQFDGPIDPSIGTMPFNNPLICVEKRNAIQRWIESLPASP